MSKLKTIITVKFRSLKYKISRWFVVMNLIIFANFSTDKPCVFYARKKESPYRLFKNIEDRYALLE